MKKKIYTLVLIGLILGFTNAFAQSGNYIYFDGSDDYVDIFPNSNLYTLKKGTIAFWFRLNDLENYQVFFSVSDKNNSGFNSDFVGLSFRDIGSGGPVAPGRRIEYAETDNGSAQSVSLSDPSLTYDYSWHHLALVADDAGSIEVYLDGNLLTMYNGYCCGPVDRFIGYATNANNMKLGVIERVSYNLYGNYFMDDFCLYDTSLTANQIQGLYNKTLLDYNSHLKINYTFETLEDLSVGLSGTNDIKDQTGNTNHGDAVGATIIHTNGIFNGQGSTQKVSIYPNPVGSDRSVLIKANQNLNHKQVSVALMDQVGKVVFNQNIDLNGNDQIINLPSSLIKGQYLLSFTNEEVKETKKIVIE